MIKHRGFVNLRSYKKAENSEVMKKKTKTEYSLEDRNKDSEDFIMHCAKQVKEQKK
tara:strand:+ start:686 stop:853 length:168 start_codon:yes stop_codon:yes gene_type:complete